MIAIAYGFLLPGIAVLHVRHVAVRQSGAILGTIAGAVVATVGLSASVNPDLRPAALFVLGVWWWTIGKMWVETAVLPRPFGYVTAALAAGAFVAVLVVTIEPYAFDLAHLVMGVWLVTLATIFARPAAAARPA